MDYIRFGGALVLRMDKGDELCETIKTVAQKERIRLASVSGIGATNDFTVGVFDTEKKSYNEHTFTGDHEITSLVGNITTMNGETYVHLHMTCADMDCNVVGGHLLRCMISLTGEIILQIADASVDRCRNTELGINTLDFRK